MDVDTQLEEATVNFLLPLRMGEGIKDKEFRELCNAILTVKEHYSSRETLPKKTAGAFLSLFPFMDGCMTCYKEDIQLQLKYMQNVINNLIDEALI